MFRQCASASLGLALLAASAHAGAAEQLPAAERLPAVSSLNLVDASSPGLAGRAHFTPVSLAEPVPHSSLLPPVMPLTVTSLAELDRRIDELTEERAEQSLGGPIATMAVGGGALLFGGYLLFLNFIFSSACDSDDEGCDDDTGLAVPGTVGVVVGAGLLLGGGLWLGDRVGTRRELAREITALERQRERVERVSPTVDLSNDEFTLVRPRGFRGVRLTLEF